MKYYLPIFLFCGKVFGQLIFQTPPENFQPKVEAAGCFIVVGSDVLFLKRQSFIVEGNNWGVPGGKLEKGESAEKAVLREVREETGIEIDSVKYLDTVYIRHPISDFTYHMFETRLESFPDQVVIDPAEHTEYRWVTLEEALRLSLITAEDECIYLVYGKNLQNFVEEIDPMLSQIEVFKGSEMIRFVDPIAKMRLSYFSEYPYLYIGTMQCERAYLKMYTQCEKSLLVMKKEGERIVGAVTGMPLRETFPEYRSWASGLDTPIDSIFYLGELVLEKDAQGKGIENQIVDEMIDLIQKEGRYRSLAVLEISRDEEDPKQPLNFVSLEKFWETKGFVKHPELQTNISWKEGEEEKMHTLIIWMKDL